MPSGGPGWRTGRCWPPMGWVPGTRGRGWACGSGGRPGVGPGGVGGSGRRGAGVRVVVTCRVPVARLPFLGAVAGPGLMVGATHHTRVDRFRGLGGWGRPGGPTGTGGPGGRGGGGEGGGG